MCPSYCYRLILFFEIFTAFAFARISANVPSGSELYDVIDQLEAYGCARTTLRTIQPGAYADLLSSLMVRNPQSCRAPEWLLEERLYLARKILPSQLSTSGLLNYNDTISLLGQEAQTTPLFPLRQGRETFNGANLYNEFFVDGDMGRDWGVAFSATPGFLLGINNYQNLNGRFYLHEGSVKLGYKRAEVSYGKMALGFGEAKHGALILSQSAAPLTLWKFAVRPHLIDSPFDVLGPFTFETWVAGEGDSSFVSNARLWGVEIGMRPFDFLELSFLELSQFGGVGMPELTASDALKMLFYSGDPALDLKRREAFATYVGFWGPSDFVKIYNELFFSRLTSFSRWFSNDASVLLGAWFPKLGAWQGRLEFVHTVAGAYSHSLWEQGWSVEDTPLGHPLGSDGEGVYLDVGFPTWEDWRPTVSLLYEARNRGHVLGLFTEERYGTSVEVKKRWRAWQLGGILQWESVTHHGYSDPGSSQLLGVMGTLSYLFL